MRSTRSTIASNRSTIALSRGASSLMWLIVSLNRTRVASRFPVELFRSISVSLNPAKMVSTWSYGDVGVERGLGELTDALGPSAWGGLATFVGHVGHYDHTAEPLGRTGRLNQM